MSLERRYDEQEITAIFKQAAEAQEAARRNLPHGEGLTLEELQQIGRETGITPEFIARAAASLGRVPAAAPRTRLLSLPVGVARTVELPGPLSDDAWDRLVVSMRDTFQARGKVRRDGSLREWTNGNLHVLAEPTDTGHRLRLRTRKGNAQGNLTLGGLNVIGGLLFLAAMAANGDLSLLFFETLMVAFVVLMGLGIVGHTVYQLPRWAKERERQMDAIAAYATELAAAPQTIATPEPEAAARLDLDALEDPAPDVETTRTRTRS